MTYRTTLKGATLFFASFLFMTAISSCSSIPEPASQDSGVLVLPVEPQKKIGEKVFGYYRIIVADLNDPKKAIFADIYSGSSSRIIGNLPAGEYRIVRHEFRYDNGSKGNSYNYSFPAITLKPGYLTVAPVLFQPKAFKNNPDDTTAWMRMDHTRLTPEKRQEILDELARDKNFGLWKVDS